jgi:large subunit ribosomal protein LP2
LILFTVGAEADENKLESLLAELKGKDITEVIACGREKFASVPSGGGAIAGGAPAAAAGGGAAPAAEAKKEEKVEEKEESDDVSILHLPMVTHIYFSSACNF